MSFNAGHLRALRNSKNAQAKMKTGSSKFKNLEFLQLNQLLDGDYPFRLWPIDPVKNPFGYLYYRTHTVFTHDGKAIGALSMKQPSHTCPRSSNWDPVPIHWEDDMGVVYEDPDEEERANLYPVFNERCACCETEKQIVDLGIKVENLPQNVQVFLEDLQGNEAWHMPITICASVAAVTKVEKNKRDGTVEVVEQTDYKADPEARFHCDLSLSEGRIKDRLLDLLEQVPDCGHPQMGRWFILKKRNQGKGVGGYELDIRPNPKPIDFELPATYPNYSSWGKGNPNPQYPRPSKRFKYSEIEAIIADPRQAHYKCLTELGVALADEEPTTQGAPF